jgi:hypothetical protein
MTLLFISQADMGLTRCLFSVSEFSRYTLFILPSLKRDEQKERKLRRFFV